MHSSLKKKSLLLFVAFITVIAFAGTRMSSSSNQTTIRQSQAKNTTKMKNPTSFDYPSAWKTVDSLDGQKLYKSALQKVEEIGTQADLHKNQPMQIRVLFYEMKYQNELEEDSFSKAIAKVDALTKSTEIPLKQLAFSIKAQLLSDYLYYHRYDIYKRSTTHDFDLKDIQTWDAKNIAIEVSRMYFASLENEKALQKIPTSDFSYVINDSAKVNLASAPTMYDFLAHRALTYFAQDESGITHPNEQFSINSKDYFGSDTKFLALSTASEDTLSHMRNWVIIMQKLVRFHLTNTYPAAHVRNTLERFQFAYDKTSNDAKKVWMEEALTKQNTQFLGKPETAEIQAKLAYFYYNLSTDASKESKDYDLLAKAHKICVDVLQKYSSDAHGSQECQRLKEQIERKNIGGTIETFQTANQPILLLTKFTNVDSVYVAVFKHNNKQKEAKKPFEIGGYTYEYPLIGLQRIALPKNSDFHEHTTEIALKPLEIGNYTVVVSSKLKGEKDKTPIWVSDFQVTNLSYSTRKISDEFTNLQVNNRQTGEVLPNIKVEVYKQDYNYRKQGYTQKKLGTYATDKNGQVQLTNEKGAYDRIVKIIQGNDTLYSYAELYRYDQSNEPNYSDYLFTDRAIYRPGQTVYFKGIHLKVNDNTSEIVPNAFVKVQFFDANYQRISALELKTNDYGSFSGSFTIPNSGLTGEMQISTTYGSRFFSVEEYKRPTFKVAFNASKEELKLGKNISLNGNAQAYAGNAIDHATVKYVLKRRITFPYWRYYSPYFHPNLPGETVVTQGITKTDKNGQFSVSFDAQKDPTVTLENVRYAFTITADVTDENGETRSTTKTLQLSEAAIQLSVNVDQFNSDKAHEITISGTNAEGETIPISGTMTISQLAPKAQPNTRRRMWQKPDQPLLSDQEFSKLFPYIEANPVSDFDRKTIGTPKTIAFNTNNSSTLSIDTTDLLSGDYRIETITKDKDGKTVKDVQFVKFTNYGSQKVQPDDILFVSTSKTTYQPGETAEIVVSSILKNQPILMETDLNGTIIATKVLKFNDNKLTIPFSIEEKHRGGVSFHFSAIRYGQTFSQDLTLHVPYTNKQLKVTFETFRDKMTPDEKEEWRLHISGPNKEKVAAEMMLTMYDASLDAFRKNSIEFAPFDANAIANYRYYKGFAFSNGTHFGSHYNFFDTDYQEIAIPTLNTFGYFTNNGSFGGLFGQLYTKEVDGNVVTAMPSKKLAGVRSDKVSEESTGMVDLSEAENTAVPKEETNETADEISVPLRSNFNETAFFFPTLKTDENGDIIVSFTAPESLTKWKILGLAYTKSMEYATVEKEAVTQKELMVQTNLPRFVRTNDTIVLTTKISNLTDSALNGTAQIQLFDAVTMQRVEPLFQLSDATTTFSVQGKQSTVASWKIIVPKNFLNSLVIRVAAKSENHTDGEELMLPVLTDKVLVTESLPLTNNGAGTKQFTFDKLVNSGSSSTLVNHAVTLEYTSNPAWYVVQALPYMIEYPHECSEQIFTRFYANSIASNIVQSSPRIKQVFEQWKNSSPEAFLSNLEKNQSLKNVLLEETPWVLDAKDESERKKRIALLFDFNTMDNALAQNLRKLQKMQTENGGFPWFPGMQESRYITQYIVSGMGHLQTLGVKSVQEESVQKIIRSAVNYLDKRLVDDYNEWKKQRQKDTAFHDEPTNLQYLYARSYFMDIPFSKAAQEAFDFYRKNTEKSWTDNNLQSQAMLALAAYRLGNKTLAQNIVKSLLERSISSEEMGLYWKNNVAGYWWYQAPIETQSILIEALQMITPENTNAINQAKIWLLRNKQTTDWKTTTATANACYALLLGGNSFVTNDSSVKIEINGKTIRPEDFGTQAEAGTGYFQATWTGKEVQPSLGKISVTRNDNGFSWGAMYWQYFESMDKVTSATTNLQLEKRLFLVKQTNAGEVIVPITQKTTLHRGDKIRVRIVLKADRDMEFVHLKDYRASGLEPLNVLSKYKWQDGLGYYESTKDVATHFFFDYLRKGTYVFEYDLRAFHSGEFSNGFAAIECMYAPEFKAHSNGVRVRVE